VAHRIYRRLGYADVIFLSKLIAEEEEVERTLEVLPRDPRVRVRGFRDGDEEPMLRLYEEWASGYTGPVKRDLGYWRGKLVELPRRLFGDAVKILVAERGGEVVGYAYYAVWSRAGRPVPYPRDSGTIAELVALDRRVLGTLLREVLLDMRRSGVKTFTAFTPLHPPYTDLFREFAVRRDGAVYMCNVVDQDRLLESLAPELSRRLEEAGVEMHLTLALETPYGATRLRIDGYSVGVERDGGGVDAEIVVRVAGTFVKLLHGIEDFDEALLRGDIALSPRSTSARSLTALARAMFPRARWFIWPADRW